MLIRVVRRMKINAEHHIEFTCWRAIDNTVKSCMCGRNCVEHIQELSNEITSHLVLFVKPNSAISLSF